MGQKFKVHIKAETESEISEELVELTYIAVGMRQWQKKWEEHYGAHNRASKEYWEAKMDAWIAKNKIVYDAD